MTGWLLSGLLVLAVAEQARSAEDNQPSEPSVSVSGSDEVSVMPTAVEILLTTSGTAELTGDAVTKFRASVKQVVDACQSLGIKELKVEPQGFLLGTQAEGGNAFQAMAAQKANAKSQMYLGSKVKVVLSDIKGMPEEALIDTISKILDTAKDAGAAFETNAGANMVSAMFNSGGVNPAVTFVVEDAESARQEARRLAFQKAKAAATELATLAGKKLDGVISVTQGAEVAPASSPAELQMQVVSAIYGGGNRDQKGNSKNRITSDRYGPVPVSATLSVVFGLKS